MSEFYIAVENATVWVNILSFLELDILSLLDLADEANPFHYCYSTYYNSNHKVGIAS